MIRKILWWFQFIINCCFMIYLASFPSNAFYAKSGGSFLISLLLLIVAVILAYFLTMVVTDKNN